MRWLLRTQERWARVVPENLASAQSENELQRMILRGVAQGARISDIARSLGLSRAQACQLHKAALMAKAVPVLIYFKERD
jgi:FixJ family two-component response regulator